MVTQFRRYCHTAKPCLYHWRLFRRGEIYKKRFRESLYGVTERPFKSIHNILVVPAKMKRY